MDISNEIISPKPIRTNSIRFNNNRPISVEYSPYDFQKEGSNIPTCPSSESLISFNSTIQKAENDYSSFKNGIDEDNFYEEISQILNKDNFDLDGTNNSIPTSVQRPKNPYYKNFKYEEEKEEEEVLDDLELFKQIEDEIKMELNFENEKEELK
ncbi:MAG: hypothetical protein MJ252_08265 [archaeon]|nr:hypothetical protein [archaeon]